MFSPALSASLRLLMYSQVTFFARKIFLEGNKKNKKNKTKPPSPMEGRRGLEEDYFSERTAL
jgi:hypothetical protein